MNLYEGMYIFPEQVEEDSIDDALKTASKEIERLGGDVKSTARLGKRRLARPMAKNESGYYVVMTFELDPQKVQALKDRYALASDLLRVQIVRSEGEAAAVQPEAQKQTEEEKDNG